MFAKLVAYVGDNHVQKDASEGEAALRAECPDLLMQDELVLFAFHGRGGAGRDDSFFTTKRVLLRNVKGVTGKIVKYFSLPYASIKAYSVETAGSTLDSDCSLKIHSSGYGQTSLDFVKGTDIFAMARYLNEAVLAGRSPPTNAGDAAAPCAATAVGGGRAGGLLDWLGGDAREIDAGEAEQQLKTAPRILMDDERVELAFKCSRDCFLFTTRRLLQIDVKGLTGTRVKYTTVKWECLRGYSVQTAGSWDRDAELVLLTNIKEMPRISQDFRKGKADMMAVQRFVSNKVLGEDTTHVSDHAARAAGHEDAGAGSLSAWLGDDCRMVDATLVEQQYRANPPILQPSEHVDMAFKGRRDLTLFTTKRLLVVDVKGFSGQKVNYTSIPWGTVQAFAVRSAGAWLDKDSEMMVWTDINDIRPVGDEMLPFNSFIQIDFQKDKVDLMGVHRYLSARCLRVAGSGPLPPDVLVEAVAMQPSDAGAVEKFLDWVGQDARTIDAEEVDRKLHTENNVLQEDERVCMAFKSGRDMLALTTKRVLRMDVQGLSGKKVLWQSVPYTSLRAFSVESAGSWDRDSEVKLFCKTYWDFLSPGSVISQDLRKGSADIIAIQAFLAAKIIGGDEGTRHIEVRGEAPGAPGGIEGFLAWLGDDAHEISPQTVERTLRSSPPVLQADESVEICFKIGRDMHIFTTKRVLVVDVQGLSGKRVEYLSYPYKYCTAFMVKSAGAISFVSNAQCAVYSDVPGARKVDQDLTKSGTDIWPLQAMLAKKLLR